MLFFIWNGDGVRRCIISFLIYIFIHQIIYQIIHQIILYTHSTYSYDTKQNQDPYVQCRYLN